MRIQASILAYALFVYARHRTPVGFGWTALVLVLLAGAILWFGGFLRPLEKPATAARVLPIGLGCLLGFELAALLLTPPSYYSEMPPVLYLLDVPGQLATVTQPRELIFLPVLFPLAVLLLGLLALSYAHESSVGARWRLPLSLVVYAYLGLWLLRSSPWPAIDVWTLQEEASAFLLEGKNPYACEYTNPYTHTEYLGQEIVKDNKIQSVPYPPLSLLLAVPGHVWGDVRYSHLLALVGAAAFLVAAGRRLGLPPGHAAELAALALLCHPGGMLLLEMSWTEPFVALASSIAFWALAGQRQRAFCLALAGMLAMKQFAVLLLPAFAACRHTGWRVVVAAAAAAGLTLVPFLLDNPQALWRGLVTFHTCSPFRLDCLSISAAVGWTFDYYLPTVLGFVAAALVAYFVVRRRPLDLSQTALGAAAIFLAFLQLSKAAHVNYFWLGEYFVLAAVVLSAGECLSAEQTAGNRAGPKLAPGHPGP